MSKKKSPPVPPPKDDRLHRPVTLSFEHYSAGAAYCLSLCTPDEVREAMDCLRQLTTLSWEQVLRSGGKGGNKAGLGCTAYRDADLTGAIRPPAIKTEFRIYGVRATQRFRIFGVYRDHVFVVLWFDRGHAIVPM